MPAISAFRRGIYQYHGNEALQTGTPDIPAEIKWHMVPENSTENDKWTVEVIGAFFRLSTKRCGSFFIIGCSKAVAHYALASIHVLLYFSLRRCAFTFHVTFSMSTK